jgi:hypothetical protein
MKAALDVPQGKVQKLFGCPILDGVFSGKGGIPRISTPTVSQTSLPCYTARGEWELKCRQS